VLIQHMGCGPQFYTAETAAMCAPGDPARDFKSEGVVGRGGYKGSGTCGPFQPYDDRPYTMCDSPGAVPADATTLGCCRHMAYTFIPNKYYVLKGTTPPVPVVVTSPRARLLDEFTWQVSPMPPLERGTTYTLPRRMCVRRKQSC
jgi:hypothetical protein